MLERGDDVVIVGAGLAGAGCAQALRNAGFDGRIVLVGNEPHAPYDRPCLSKELLLGDIERPPALVDPSWLAGSGIELLLGEAVVALDPATRSLQLAGGRALQAGHIVLATGARPRELPWPGSSLAGVARLRTWDDAIDLKQALREGSHLAIIGAGLIGCEVASTARALGARVTLIESAPELLTRTLGPALGRFCRQRLGELGVDVRLSARVQALLGQERVQALQWADGSRMPVDAVLLSIGAEPEVALALQAGIACEQGIVVDVCGRTSVPGIYAAGDAARWPLRGGGSRSLESYINSQQQAVAVAKAIMGTAAPSLQVLKGWTKIAGHHIQVAGEAAGDGSLVVRGTPGAGPALLFRVAGQRVLGVVAVDAARDFGLAARLVEQEALPDAVLQALGDPGAPLKNLLAAARGA